VKCPIDQKIPAEWENLPGHPRFKQLLAFQMEVHAAKGGDYSGGDRDMLANLRQCEDIGIAPWRGVLVRISDKWERIKSLARNGRENSPAVKDESILDTMLDAANYFMLDYILFEEEQLVRTAKLDTTTDQAPGQAVVGRFLQQSDAAHRAAMDTANTETRGAAWSATGPATVQPKRLSPA
jgi:hypothetical protein